MDSWNHSPDRRTFLAGSLGMLGVLAAGCGTSTSSDASSPGSTASSTTVPERADPTSAERAGTPGSPEPRASATTAEPRSDPSTTSEPPTAAMIIERATVPVLCYHQLRDWRSGDSTYDRANLICPPRYFRAQLDALVDGGWNTITPDQYLVHLTTGAVLPAKPVMLSFDDASASQATEGLPQLHKRGMTGTFFVMTVVLGKPRWMSIRDVKRVADAGMTIGCHTWDHHAVTDLSGEDWKVQLDQTRDTLRQASGQPVDHFAYPYGVVGKKAFRHLKEAGYRTAFQLEANKISQQAPLYTLRRSLVVSTWSGATLIKHLTRHRP